ncbi:MAG: hypothetical protein IJB85_02655 [Clostridia bacterium]|nr:hypothetical protein [Clostridia bacterium]
MLRKITALFIAFTLLLTASTALAYESFTGLPAFDFKITLSAMATEWFHQADPACSPVNLDGQNLTVFAQRQLQDEALLNTVLISEFLSDYTPAAEWSAERAMDLCINQMFMQLFMFENSGISTPDAPFIRTSAYYDLLFSGGAAFKFYDEEYLSGCTSDSEWMILPFSILDADGNPYQDQSYIYYRDVIADPSGAKAVIQFCIADQEQVSLLRADIRDAIAEYGSIHADFRDFL